MTSQGRSIELFFHDGDPDGMTTATIPFQWTGHVLVTNRTQVFDALKEPEASQPGIYLLVGETENGLTLYVGETDEIRTRINQHIKDASKDWWERAIFVTAQGEPLNKAHARYLESRIYGLASRISKVALANNKAPTESPLSKAALAHMEDFLKNLRLVLPALRFDFLTEQTKPKVATTSSEPENQPVFFVLSTKEVAARARQEGGDFVVEEGSDARSKWVGSTSKDSTYGRLYESLVSQGVIGDQDGARKFLQSYAFNSVSAAASVVTGRPTSGTGAWLLESDQTKNYGDYEAAKAEQTEEEATT
ncbi:MULTISPECIES: GIY-YIG nuclease family protein [Paracoccaceae]|uniref:GIY-YIG catalytic domain-containing protein n=1 Tax=Sedimentitalea nanhaiensis TaxID=999627 RepID=A0A1I7B0I0_9RHOB|nr:MULTISPECIES: GIY-YIG nuclease family protein [Paracoccaceae]MDE9450434.1 GIY-YIG nuclease family protein [Aliiroseovarius sp. Z3]SFT80642.1 GIY-YIG catalytic domain-containing protein [Sedimentitalea nanhaiensis]